jgi:hypothetical protein
MMADLVGLLKAEQKLLRKKLTGLEKAIEALGGGIAKDVTKSVNRGKKMSEATKQKLRIAAKKRWASIKKVAS